MGLAMLSTGNRVKVKHGMKRITFGLLALLLGCGWMAAGGSVAQKQAGPAAAFSATPVKSSYSAGEAMLLLLRLENTGPQAIVADARFALGRAIQVRVTGPQGKAVDWAASFEPQTPGFREVAPGGRITRIVCLNCGARDPFSYPFGEPGTYTVRLSYTPSDLTPAERATFPHAVALDHSIEAAPFEVHVTPPVVRFTAQPEQPVFHAGEPVTFNFRLQNTGSLSVLAAYDLPLAGAVRLRVTDANGNPVPVSGRQPVVQPLLSTVDAGSAVEATHPITPQNLYGAMSAGFDIRQPGTYTVEAVYDLEQPIDVLQGYVGVLPILIVPGPIAAPPVKFTVAPAAPPNASGK
jgi:hypothetical protein